MKKRVPWQTFFPGFTESQMNGSDSTVPALYFSVTADLAGSFMMFDYIQHSPEDFSERL